MRFFMEIIPSGAEVVHMAPVHDDDRGGQKLHALDNRRGIPWRNRWSSDGDDDRAIEGYDDRAIDGDDDRAIEGL